MRFVYTITLVVNGSIEIKYSKERAKYISDSTTWWSVSQLIAISIRSCTSTFNVILYTAHVQIHFQCAYYGQAS